MFKDAKLIKRYCTECGNVTNLSVSRTVTKLPTNQSFVFIGLSIFIITTLVLAKHYI